MATELKNKLNQILNEKTTKIIPENIKDGVTIFDVTGTLEEGVDTSDANATANDIVTNKTAYVNGQKLTGTYTGIVPSGTKQITENGTVDVTNYASANVNVASSPSFPPDWSEINYNSTPQAVIDGFNYAKTIAQNWNSSTTGMNAKYNGREDLMFFPLINTSNVTRIDQCFYNCKHLLSVPLLNTQNTTRFDYAFYNCTALRDIPQFNTNKVTNMHYMVSGCFKLTDESLNNILAMCINVSPDYSKPKTLSEIGLNSTYHPVTRLQTLSNYQDFLDAGWTTGY